MSSNDRLKLRIRNGAFWLVTHGYGWCHRWHKPYDGIKYAKHLKLYEHLVDEAKKHGISEKECLTIGNGVTVANMTSDMILVYLCHFDIKSRLNSPTVAQIINYL